MAELKSIRGTILYATVIYNAPSGTGQSIVVPVFNLNIAGIKLNTFLTESSGEQLFGTYFSEMNEGTAISCRLSITNPNGSFLNTVAIAFGSVVTVGWSEAIITAFGPPIDPDWQNNPNYITMNQQFTVTAHST
jgi:hypothetical protein